MNAGRTPPQWLSLGAYNVGLQGGLVIVSARARSQSLVVDVDRRVVYGAADGLEIVSETPRASVTLVVPALNEAENIGWVLERVPSVVDEVILVDGDSVDDTVEVARRSRPDIRVVRQRGRGKGCAVRTGFQVARGDYIVMIDADGSMDPEEIPSFVDALDLGYQFVKGSRHVAGGGSEDLTRVRELGNRALVSCVNLAFLVSLTDLCYGYIALRRDIVPQLSLTSRGFEIETELVLRAVKTRLSIAEVPSIELPRRHGESNLNAFRDGKRVLRRLIRERLVREPRAVVDVLPAQPARPQPMPTTAAEPTPLRIPV